MGTENRCPIIDHQGDTVKHIDWSIRADPADWRWAMAELVCADVASTIKELEPERPWYERLNRYAPAKHLSGYGVAPPWVHNPRTDRVIAYHGFIGSWVGWDRGGAVIKLAFKDIVRFLRGEM